MGENSLEFLVNTVLAIEKLRVAVQVRKTHIEKQGRKDPETDELLERILILEKYADNRMAKLIKQHPAYPWFSKVKGVGPENIVKVIGPIDIKKAKSISSLWKFAGYHVDEDGKAPKRQKGGSKLEYNSRLRTMCHRLGMSLLRAGLRHQCQKCKGIFGAGKLEKTKGKCPNCGSTVFITIAQTAFSRFYLDEKERYIKRFKGEGKKIVVADQLPIKDGKRYEPEDMISEGHIHNMALRSMIKLFLSCLWLVWRKNVGLPISDPYSIARQGHAKMISPWEMLDSKQAA